MELILECGNIILTWPFEVVAVTWNSLSDKRLTAESIGLGESIISSVVKVKQSYRTSYLSSWILSQFDQGHHS